MGTKQERELRSELVSQQVEIYSKSMWKASDLAVVLDVHIQTARKYFNKVKQDLIAQGKKIEVYGKLPKEECVKSLGIDLKNEIKYLNLIKQTA